MLQIHPVDVTSAGFKANPHPLYAQLRAERPVCQIALRSQTAWLVTRYEDVSALLKDQRLAKNPANALTVDQLARQRKTPKMFAPLRRNMLSQDDPDHARLKRLVQAAFTPRRVETLSSQVQETANALVSAVTKRESFDLIEDFALPLPVTVISELLGVPQRDRARFARWSRVLITSAGGGLSVLLGLPAMLSFLRYLRTLIEMKRAVPADDLVSALVQDQDGERLNEDELMAMITILLSAGHETTTNLIGNGMLALMQAPEQRERLRAEPDLMPVAVEELLRFAGPIETSTHRFAREDMEIAGVAIPRGALVFGGITSANHDERHFTNGEKLDVSRSSNRHLTFGEGGHYCVGAALARLEGRIAFSTLLNHLPDLRPARPVGELRWRPGIVLRGLEKLPVVR